MLYLFLAPFHFCEPISLCLIKKLIYFSSNLKKLEEEKEIVHIKIESRTNQIVLSSITSFLT